jgi:hypothetical protein
MTVRLLVIALSLALAACRVDRRAPHDSAGVATAPLEIADGCRQTGGVRPDTGIAPGSDAAARWRRALARGIAFVCAITPAERMRFVVAGDTTLPSVDSIAVYGDTSSRHPVQVLTLRSELSDLPEPFITNYLRAIDLDADGYADLMLGASCGATGNTSYAVWRFDPRTRRFESDTVLSSLFNPEPVRGRPCVRTSSNSSARDDERGLFCMHSGSWQLDSLEENVWDRARDAVVHSILVRRGDSLVVVKSETRPDSS